MTRWLAGAVVLFALVGCGSEDGAVSSPESSTTQASVPPTPDQSTTSVTPIDPAVTDFADASSTSADTIEPPATGPPVAASIPAAPTRVPLCAEVERLVPDVIGDQPKGSPDPGVMAALSTYGSQHRDVFGGMWIDRDHGGTVVLAFTDDPDLHEAQILALRPAGDDPPEGTGPSLDPVPLGERDLAIDVVHARFPEHELMQLMLQVDPTVQDLGVSGSWTSTDLLINRVAIHIPYVSEEQLAVLAETVPVDAVCVEGTIGEPPDTDGPLAVIPEPGADPLVLCGGATFRLSSVESAQSVAEMAEDPAVDAFVEVVTRLGPGRPPASAEGWVLLERTDDTAVFASFTAEPDEFMSFERTPGGWSFRGSGQGLPRCTVALPPGLDDARWELDPAHPPPQPADTTVHLLVTETSCANGEPVGDRLRGPQVVETDEAVLIAFATVPLPQADCPGNPAVAVTVELPAPLGERELRDGLEVELRPGEAGRDEPAVTAGPAG